MKYLIQICLVFATVPILSSGAFAETRDAEPTDDVSAKYVYPKTSGILKVFRDPFTLKKEHVERITTAILKAQAKLEDESQFYFHVHREDDRFYEVETLNEIFTDPNAEGSRIDFISWNLLQDINETDGTDKPYRILRLRYTMSGIELHIDGKEMDWALVTADQIEAEIERTLYKRFNWINFTIILGGILVYFFFARLLVALLRADKFKRKETETVVDMNIMLLIQAPPMLALIHAVLSWDSVWTWLNYSPSYFLWGDVVADYSRLSDLSSNLLWVVIVGLVVSVIGNILTSKFLSSVSERPGDAIDESEQGSGGNG